MATTHRIELSAESYELLKRESERRGVKPDELASELLQAELAQPAAAPDNLDRALDRLAELRAKMPPIDAVALVREGREELEQRALRGLREQ